MKSKYIYYYKNINIETCDILKTIKKQTILKFI